MMKNSLKLLAINASRQCIQKSSFYFKFLLCFPFFLPYFFPYFLPIPDLRYAVTDFHL